jgi:branched-subunit amino acid ABC-type transport system permease component
VIAAIDAQTIVDALGLGAVYALMAVGIGLVFGVLRTASSFALFGRSRPP